MPPSRSHSPMVLPTSMKGRPQDRPNTSMIATFGRRRLRITSRQPGRGAALAGAAAVAGSEGVVIVHREGRMVGEAWGLRYRARAQPVAQARRHELVVDAPAH